MIEPCYRYRAAMVRVIDGDTYVLDVDLGFRVHVGLEVRLRDVSCPELREPGGIEARTYVEGLTAPPASVVIESYRDQRSFTRWVADVYVNGASLADLIVNAGHGMRV